MNGCCGLLVDVAIGGNQGFGQGFSRLSDFSLSATVASGGSGLPGLAAALIVALAGLAALAIWFVLAYAARSSTSRCSPSPWRSVASIGAGRRTGSRS